MIKKKIMVSCRYNKFWLRTHQKPEYFKAQPNAGHYAIAAISQMCNAKVMYVLAPPCFACAIIASCSAPGSARREGQSHCPPLLSLHWHRANQDCFLDVIIDY
jgi:hypothetical protein